MSEKKSFNWDKLSEIEPKYQDYEYPMVSIVIPTYNCSEKIGLTIDSIRNQVYPDFEIIMIDAGSTDRTLEVIKNYRDDRIHLYSVSEYHRYEILNKGISHAQGQYINFLFPGDFYIHKDTLHHMMEVALEGNFPQLVFCGTLLRDARKDVKILYRELSLKLLKKGLQPTSLQSCWFHTDTFKEIGKFQRDFTLRGGFELMCRFCLNPSMHFVSTNRVLTDYDLRHVTKGMIVSHFTETFKTILKYFGFSKAVVWLFTQKDLYRFTKLWWRSVKVAFLGRH